MTLDEFVSLTGLRYAVMPETEYLADPLYAIFADSPGKFAIQGVFYVAMNLEPQIFINVAQNAEAAGKTVVYEFTTDSDKVCFLTWAQVIHVKETLEDKDPNEHTVSVPDTEV